MIFPISSTLLTREAIDHLAAVVGVSSPLTSRDTLNAANLAASLGLDNPKDVLSDDGHVLSHFSVSFYVKTSDIGGIVSCGSLKVLQLSEDAFILTADILTWKGAVVNGLSKHTSTEVREVMNFIFAYLRDNGFGLLFSNFKRVNLVMDKTLCLEKLC